jgi:hypothetical protein
MNKNFNMSNKISDQTYQAIIGNLLGDAHLGFTRNNKHTGQPIGNSQLSMSLKSNEYISYLVNIFYISICNTNPIKPVVKNNIVTHYRFWSKNLPELTILHNNWYIRSAELNKFIKIVPSNIANLLTSLSLALWIMDDGYWANGSLYLCTDNFTLEEVELLILTLNNNFGLLSGQNKRIKSNKEICWRIRLSSKTENISKLRSLVIPHFIPSMLYKVGL